MLLILLLPTQKIKNRVYRPKYFGNNVQGYILGNSLLNTLYTKIKYILKLTSDYYYINIFASVQVFQCIYLRIVRKRGFLMLWTLPFLSSTSKENSAELQPRFIDHRRAIKKAIQEADDLFESNKYQEAATALLPFKVFIFS